MDPKWRGWSVLFMWSFMMMSFLGQLFLPPRCMKKGKSLIRWKLQQHLYDTERLYCKIESVSACGLHQVHQDDPFLVFMMIKAPCFFFILAVGNAKLDSLDCIFLRLLCLYLKEVHLQQNVKTQVIYIWQLLHGDLWLQSDQLKWHEAKHFPIWYICGSLHFQWMCAYIRHSITYLMLIFCCVILVF